MRSRRFALLLIALGAAVLGHATGASAQTFPPNQEYTALPCGDEVMTDRRRDENGAVEERDLVGDRNDAAGFRAVDDQFLYLRLRVDRDAAPNGTLRPFAWGVEIDVDRNRETYEILGLVDGVTGNVFLFRNSSTEVRNDPTDPADTPAVATYPFSSHGQVTATNDSDFGGDDDFFVTFALPWSDLDDLGLKPDTPVSVWASSSDTTSHLNGDLACHDGSGGRPKRLSEVDSGRTVLDDDIDSDRDGATDADEVEHGSDPRDPDSRPGDLVLAGGGGCAAGRADPRAAVVAMLGLALLLARRSISRGAGRDGRRRCCHR